MSETIGQIAAVATSVAWSFTSVFFTLSGRKVGSTVVNRTRLLLAVVFVALMHLATQGTLIPTAAEPFRWGWLAFSGLIGFVIGDGFLFQAFIMIGPRLSMLMMALAPVLSTLFGWVFLREVLIPQELIGILVTVGGIALVVSDRQPPAEPGPERDPRQFALGLLFGFGAAAGQAGGFLTSKLGLQGDFSALSGTLMRLIAAVITIWIITFLTRQARPTVDSLKQEPRALLFITGGAITGPFIGVWLSLIAVQNAPLGIASTLTSLAPIFLLPVGYFLFNERFGVPAIIGTLAAVGGTALLFIS